MATEYPPLNKIYVFGYSANDRDFPILSSTADPRVAGYQVPKDLSACPDKRYPNHVFTGAQPISGDQRVRHVWEILPSPWVPFTRYDDDLGPVQGRRRSVKNEGQVAIRQADKQVTYEAREGSAIVYTELEETWSIATDEDGNSLFPIKNRDFYDASRGPIRERRQLLVPTGNEVASLENINGVITQTSYEPYNDFLSVKIVQTYVLSGPLLIGKATDNDGQLVTVKTQRKRADGYVPPKPTATLTVEASAEDKESVVERIVETPEVFAAETYRKTKEDLTPQKFKASQEDSTVEETIKGTADPDVTLKDGEFAKSEQQINKFVKRVSTTSRVTTVNPNPLIESVLTNDGQLGTRTLTLSSGPQTITPSATIVDANVEALGDGRTIKTETTVPNVFSGKTISLERPDAVPQKFRVAIPIKTEQENVDGNVQVPQLEEGVISKSEQQVRESVKRISSTTRDVSATKTLESVEYTTELGGGYANVEETYPFGGTLSSKVEFGTISDQTENIGDGTVLRRRVVLEDPPVLSGQEYDDGLDIVIPYKQFVAKADTATGKVKQRVTPRDPSHSLVVDYDSEEIKTSLSSYYVEVPDMVSVKLPDKLVRINVVTTGRDSSEKGSGFGDTYFWSEENSSSASGSVTYDIEEGFSGVVPATRAIFFLPNNNASPNAALSRVEAKSGVNGFFPVTRPEAHEIVIISGSESFSQNESASFDSGSTSKGSSTSYDVNQTVVPPTIHKRLEVGLSEQKGKSATVDVFPNYLEETSPPIFPAGKYLYQINAQPYRFGFVRVEAVIVNIDKNYV